MATKSITPAAGGMHFTLGHGNSRNCFARAPMHTKRWDDQKAGLRQYLGMPAHGTAR
jgi:hypothetical protein